jgi:hypothetical protein
MGRNEIRITWDEEKRDELGRKESNPVLFNKKERKKEREFFYFIFFAHSKLN